MPALLNKYPGYAGIYEYQPEYTYIPAWSMLLYSGQALTWSTNIKSTIVPVSF
jgi:hypothetical protein